MPLNEVGFFEPSFEELEVKAKINKIQNDWNKHISFSTGIKNTCLEHLKSVMGERYKLVQASIEAFQHNKYISPEQVIKIVDTHNTQLGEIPSGYRYPFKIQAKNGAVLEIYPNGSLGFWVGSITPLQDGIEARIASADPRMLIKEIVSLLRAKLKRSKI